MPKWDVQGPGGQTFRDVEAPSQEAAIQAMRTRVEAGTTGVPTAGSLRIPPVETRSPAEAAKEYGGITAERGIFGLQKGEGPAADVVNAVGDVVVPHNAVEAGQLVGTAGAGPALSIATRWMPRLIPYVSRIPMSIIRVIGGALTAETANDLFGGPEARASQGLTQAGLSNAAGETAAAFGAPVIAKGAKLLGFEPGKRAATRAAAQEAATKAAQESQVAEAGLARGSAKAAAGATAEAQTALGKAQASEAAARAAELQAQGRAAQAGTAAQGAQGAEATARFGAGQNAHQLGTAIEAAVPPLSGARTASELSNLGTFRGTAKGDIGAYQMGKLQEAAQRLPQGEATTIKVPTLARPNEARMAAEVRAGINPDLPLSPEIDTLFTQQFGPRIIDRFTLQEASEGLKQLGMRGYAGKQAESVTRTATGAPTRGQYGRARREIMGELESLGGTEAAATWDEGRRATSVGYHLLELLKQEGVFERLPNDKTYLTLGKLQEYVRARAQSLRDRMTPEDWQAMKAIVFMGRDVSESTGVVKIGALGQEAAKAGVAAQQARAGVAAAQQATQQAAGATQQAAGGVRSAMAAQRAAEERLGAQMARPFPRTPPTYPWTQQQMGRIMLDAAMLRAAQQIGVGEGQE